MDFAYQDIIGLRRPVHGDDGFNRRHPKMARLNRAKLFAPFAALTGFDEAIRAKQIEYVPRRVPGEEEARELNRALNLLAEAVRAGERRARVRVEYFEPCADANSAAFGRLGLYRARTGVVKRVDPVARRLELEDGAIDFRAISAITDPSGERLTRAQFDRDEGGRAHERR